MSKGEGKKVAVKFNLPVNALALTPTIVVDSAYSVPVGTVTYSNQYSTTYAATKAFDGLTTTYWDTRLALPQWNMVELPEARLVAGFRFYSGASYRPNSIDLYGSNDGTNFDLLKQTTNANATGWKEHTFTATVPYKFYKWIVNSTHTAGRVYVYELQLLFARSVDKSCNENAFTVSGQEYLFVDGPINNGPLQNKTYSIKTVSNHPTEPNTLLIEIDEVITNNVFRNVVGDIAIAYNQALGNLAGAGGPVASFEEIFTPLDLIEFGNPRVREFIEASVSGSVELKFITKLSAFSRDYIEASVGGSIELIHVDDINP